MAYAAPMRMVNGGHRALALEARAANDDRRLAPLEPSVLRDPSLQGALVTGRLADRQSDDLRHALFSPQISFKLGGLHTLMNEALREKHPELAGNLDYGLAHVGAYAEHPESVSRVLQDFKRLDLFPFIDAFDARLAEPARICNARGLDVQPFVDILDVFVELVESIDSFEDNKELRYTDISHDADAKAIARFTTMITGWVGDRKEVEKRAARFAKLLHDHRTAAAP